MEQLDIFSYTMPEYKITKKIRLIECFAGIGSQAKCFQNLGADFEHYKVIEFDKHAIDSYNAIHNTNFTTSDIRDVKGKDLEIVDSDKYCYILTYSFPCQDLSLAGLGKGMAKGSGTRSGLLWEVERILDELHKDNLHIDCLLMENVPMVIGKKNIENFKLWRRKLEQLGYQNYVQCLNAKDYGIPQNRNRCFMVSVYGDYHYTFPSKKQLKLRLKDMLEDNVEEKYFLTDSMVEYFIHHTEEQKEKGNGFQFNPIDIERERERVSRALNTNSMRTDNTFIQIDVCK